MNGALSLKGSVAIVTGAGRGLGRAMALALADAGADVSVAARSTNELEQTAREVSKLGRRSVAIPTDVTNAVQVQALVDRTVSELGRLDVLVNNSGTYVDTEVVDMTDEQWDIVINTNLRGCFFCTRAAGRVLREQGHGKVVNIASNLGLVGRSGFSAYCASKAAIINFTRAVALEWAPSGVQVNAIAPGYFETAFNEELRADPGGAARVTKRIPVGRMARPEELGGLVVYLAAGASDFMTGETIVIDGGESAR